MSIPGPKRTDGGAPLQGLAGLLAAVLAALVLGIPIAGCGSDQHKSAATEASLKRSLAGAPAPLAMLYSRGDEIVDGGKGGFQKQLSALHGYPIVVNKWASWCGPCRSEFPFFQKLSQKYGKRVAFLGVDGQDERGAAEDFLKDYPVPYPSYYDPDDEIAKLMKATVGFPTTTFYDRQGKLVYTKPGGYASRAALEKDIKQYVGKPVTTEPPQKVQPSDLDSAR